MEKMDRDWSKYLSITKAHKIKLCLKQTVHGGFYTTDCKPVEFLNKTGCEGQKFAQSQQETRKNTLRRNLLGVITQSEAQEIPET